MVVATLRRRSCDDGAQAAFGSVWSGAIVLTRSPGGGRTGSAAAVLGCDCGRYGECGCCGPSWYVAGCRNEIVPKGRRHATSDVSAISEAAVRPVSLICGAGGDRTSSSAGLLHAGGCAPARASGATLQPEAAAWSIARRQRNGMPIDLLAAQGRRSLRSTRHCEPMWRNDWQGSSSLGVGLLFPALLCAGKAAGMDTWRTVGA